MKRSLTFFFALSFNAVAFSQSIMVGTGFATDLNNAGKSFNFIPLEMQWYPFQKTTFSLKCNYDAGINVNSNGDAYTLTPDLPPHVSLSEKYRTGIFSIGICLNIGLYTAPNLNKIYINYVPLLFCAQHFKAVYKNYDNKNYEILNPDVGDINNGLATMFGIQYHFSGNKQFALDFQSPLLQKRNKAMNHKYAAPLRLKFGYHFNYKRR